MSRRRNAGGGAVRTTLVALICMTLAALAAEGQVRRPLQPPPSGPTPRAGSWEVAGGYTFVGGYDLGSATAALTRNTTSDTGPFDLFRSDSSVVSTGALVGRLAYYFSPRLAVEGGVRFGRPVNRIELSGDAEDAPDEVAEQTLDQYVFDASAVWHFPRAAFSRGRGVPFVFGGAGYIRELHESQELVETGTEYHAGGGVKFWFSNARRRFGLRGEGGVSFRDGGLDFEESVRVVPIAGVTLIFLF